MNHPFISSFKFTRTFSGSIFNTNIRWNNRSLSDTQKPPTLVKPVEPFDLCCGNSCPNCVWNSYFDEMRAYDEELQRRKELELKNNIKEEGNAKNETIKGNDGEMEIGMKAFMELEKKLKTKVKKRNQKKSLCM